MGPKTLTVLRIFLNQIDTMTYFIYIQISNIGKDEVLENFLIIIFFEFHFKITLKFQNQI